MSEIWTTYQRAMARAEDLNRLMAELSPGQRLSVARRVHEGFCVGCGERPSARFKCTCERDAEET